MFDGQTFPITQYEALGLIGAGIYSTNYVLAAYDRLTSQSPLYYMSNLCAALLVLISLTQSFNLASTALQIFFVTVSVIGIFRRVDTLRAKCAFVRQQHAPGKPSSDPIQGFLTSKKPSSGYSPFHERPTPLTENVRSTRLFARQDL